MIKATEKSSDLIGNQTHEIRANPGASVNYDNMSVVIILFRFSLFFQATSALHAEKF
jgi:hypothetical protein